MNRRNILIIEDDAEIREGIRILLADDELAFVEAGDGEQGIALMSEDIDLVILDIMMPGIDGVEVCRRIRKDYSVPILFLSAKSQEADKLIGLKVGADDYLTKPFSYIELNAKIRSLLRRYYVYKGRDEAGSVSVDDYLRIDNITVSLSDNEVMLGDEYLNLTETEYQILLMLMQKPNRTYSAKMIYEAVWNEQYYYGASSIVMVHISNLRRKLEKDPQHPEHIMTAWGKGYLFRKQVKI